MQENNSVESDKVIKEESEQLALGEKPPWGIALSGGGIRSASFGIGVLQAIHAKNFPHGTGINCFDYLSTVSGGGYAGTCLSWFRTKYGEDFFPFGKKRSGDIDLSVDFSHEPWRPNVPLPEIGKNINSLINRFINGKEDAEGGDTGKPEPVPGLKAGEEDILNYIRLHGRYLTPTNSLDLISIVATVLRGMIVSALYYFVLFTAVMLLLISLSVGFYHIESAHVATGMLLNNFGYLPQPGDFSSINGFVAIFSVFVFTAAIVLLMVGTAIKVLSSFLPEPKDYRMRNGFQKTGGLLLKTAMLSAIAYSITFISEFVSTYGVIGIIGGLQASYVQFRSMAGKSPLLASYPGLAKLSVSLAAGVFVYVIFLYAFIAAEFLWLSQLTFKTSLLAVIVFFFASFIPINYTAVGRMYRDRLTEAFLADDKAILVNRWMPAIEASVKPLHELCRYPNEKSGRIIRPYHLINANAVMINDAEMRLKGRAGTGFLLSPMYVGSDATGYVETHLYSNKLTVATAMAISGAAANPHTGAAGEGDTRNVLVSFLMTFFNIRLGLWGPNPALSGKRTPRISFPGIPALFGLGFHSESHFLDLTDGGHFENLGLYELFRRRCSLIISSDAGADEDFSFTDIGNAIARARADFGLSVRFDIEDDTTTYDLRHLLPGTAGDDPFAKKFNLAKRGFALAHVYYPAKNNEPEMVGLLIYIKTTLTPSLPADIYGYKSKHPSYPDQTTADQSFGEFQFEAYRELGYQITQEMFRDETACREISKVPALHGQTMDLVSALE